MIYIHIINIEMTLMINIAKKIPDNVRSNFILTVEDPINNAQPHQHNENMVKLARVWYDFIETDKEFTMCSICLDNILTSFRQMKSALIELENEYQKLKHL